MASWWALREISGKNIGKVHDLNPEKTTLGRFEGDLVIEDDEISRTHAEFVFDAGLGLIIVEDLKSRNGVKVNGTRVQRKVISAGDILRVGRTEFLVLAPDAQSNTSTGLSGILKPNPFRKEIERPKTFWSRVARLYRHPIQFFSELAFDDAIWPALGVMVFALLTDAAFRFVITLSPSHVSLKEFAVLTARLGSTVAPANWERLSILLGVPFGIAICLFNGILFHVIATLLGGKGAVVKGLQVAMYVSAFAVTATPLLVIPQATLFVAPLSFALSALGYATAANQTYQCESRRAYGFAGVFVLLVCVAFWAGQSLKQTMRNPAQAEKFPAVEETIKDPPTN